MATNIHNLIAAISPDVYCDPEKKEAVKKVIAEEFANGSKSPYIKAAEKAKPKASQAINYVSTLEGDTLNPWKAFSNPIDRHKLIYDSFGESLEPIYFWILDTLEATGYTKIEKIVDNFNSSPGSGHFSEMGAKATRMQEEAMKIFGAVNQVIKSILNIIYDLKEFNIRLQVYDDLKPEKNSDPERKKAAEYSLKQIWMDSVDVKRGTTSLKGLVQNFDYVTIIDAFMQARDAASLNDLDLNERVKRILQQRIEDYKKWVVESERELRKRYEIEKNYLRSQYNTVQLYARWIKPYLVSAKQLENRAEPTAGLVTAFNTTLLELTVLAARGYDPHDDVVKGDLPKIFEDKNGRDYRPYTVIEFKFRSSPERFGQNYGFRGRTEIIFTSYALNKDEAEALKNQIEYDNFGDILAYITGATEGSLEQIKEDINFFLEDKKPENKEDKKEEKVEDTNPFTELFSFLKSKPKEQKKESKDKNAVKKIAPDNEYEQIIRAINILEARRWCVKFYGIYKKSHGMSDYGPLDDTF